ncbi:MAG TPA: hypothetical protein VLW85_04155, partial [Myxococcales bacterium]|nr:hypothetical protein [Myxococcales bacterium]
ILLAHAVLGFFAVAAGTAQAALALIDRPRRDLGWLAAAVVCAQLALGLLLYPAYRLQVRAADLERSAPALVQLFDFKEHMAALSLALIAGAALAGREEQKARWPLASLWCTGAAFLWLAAVVGVVVTSRHAV